jgi:AcrR family transcriptional regulator
VNTKTRKERKVETRQTLLNAAAHLFVNEGYDTTLAAIADHAGVHTQTLISHFPTKADILTGIWQENLRAFEKAFLTRTTDALSAYRAYIEASSVNYPESGLVLPMADSLPAITAEARQALFRIRELIAEGIAEDMAVDNTRDLRPTLFACMVFSGILHVSQSWYGKRFNKDKYLASLLEVFDTAQAMLNRELSRE